MHEWITTVGVRPSTADDLAIRPRVKNSAPVCPAFGEQSEKPSDAGRDGDEMADVLWVLMALANQTGVDLTQALADNVAKKTLRDADRHKNNPKLT